LAHEKRFAAEFFEVKVRQVGVSAVPGQPHEGDLPRQGRRGRGRGIGHGGRNGKQHDNPGKDERVERGMNPPIGRV